MPTPYVRAAFETSGPGNESVVPSLSTKKVFPPLTSFTPHYGTTVMERDDEMRGQDEPIAVLPDSFDPSWESSGRAYPDWLGMALKLFLGDPVSTAGNGVITDQDAVVVPTGATRHTWTAPFGPAGASPRTFQLDAAYKDQAVFFALRGAAGGEMTIESPEEGGVTVAASGPANYITRQADPVLTPAYEALSIRPFTRGNLTLPSWLSGTGTHEEFSLTVENPVENTRSLGIASKFPDIMEKASEGPIVFRGSLSQRQLDADDIDALVGATGFAATARWVSDSIIASGYPYKLYVVMSNCQYVDGDPEEMGNKRRHGASFDFKSTTPSSGSTTVQLVNATSSYA